MDGPPEAIPPASCAFSGTPIAEHTATSAPRPSRISRRQRASSRMTSSSVAATAVHSRDRWPTWARSRGSKAYCSHTLRRSSHEGRPTYQPGGLASWHRATVRLRWVVDSAGGLPTNAAGAVLLDRAAQTHQQLLATDAKYRDWFEKHRTLVFVAQMLMPITPDSIGVSLNPALRAMFFNRSKAIWDMGPVYTFNHVLPQLGQRGGGRPLPVHEGHPRHRPGERRGVPDPDRAAGSGARQLAFLTGYAGVRTWTPRPWVTWVRALLHSGHGAPQELPLHPP